MQAFYSLETVPDFAVCSNFRQRFFAEIENALLTNHKRLYHLGMEDVAKSTLSEAMNRRNPEIFKALFEEILDRVMAVAPKHKFKFKIRCMPSTAQQSTFVCLAITGLITANIKAQLNCTQNLIYPAICPVFC